jgi:hypothetical protein
MEDGRAYAQAGDQPYGRDHIINIAYALIFNIGVYPDGNKEWENNDILDKTWDTFKTHFTTDHKLYRKKSHASQSRGFHAANHAQRGMQANMLADHSEDITMLASATALDRGTVSTLISTNAILSSHLDQNAAVLLAANSFDQSRKHCMRRNRCHPQHHQSVNTSGKAGAQIPHLPQGDDSSPWGR